MRYYLLLKSDSGMTKITVNNWNYISKKKTMKRRFTESIVLQVFSIF